MVSVDIKRRDTAAAGFRYNDRDVAEPHGFLDWVPHAIVLADKVAYFVVNEVRRRSVAGLSDTLAQPIVSARRRDTCFRRRHHATGVVVRERRPGSVIAIGSRQGAANRTEAIAGIGPS